MIQWIALVVIFAVAFEATARVQDWVRYRMPMLSRLRSEEDLMMRDGDGAHGRPGSQYRKWVMNALGLRGPEVAAAKPPGTLRVLALGASETFGLYESPGHEYPRQLEDTLNARIAAGACGRDAPRHVEVLNGALPGMSLPTVDETLRNRLFRFDPDIIVYYPSPAEYLDDKEPSAAPPDSSSRSHALPARAAFYPRVLDIVRNEVKSLAPQALLSWAHRRDIEAQVARHGAGWRFTTVPPERLAGYDTDFRHLLATIRTTGAVAVVATHANVFMQSRGNQPGNRPPAGDSQHLLEDWERFYPRATGATILAFDSLARQTTLRAARDSNAIAVDLAPVLAQAGSDRFADFVHFTDAGAVLVASTLAPAVLAAARRKRLCGERR